MFFQGKLRAELERTRRALDESERERRRLIEQGSVVFGDRGGGEAGGEPAEALPREADHTREVLDEGHCANCGDYSTVQLRAIWLTFQWDREQPRISREWWCSYCIDSHFKRHPSGGDPKRS